MWLDLPNFLPASPAWALALCFFWTVSPCPALAVFWFPAQYGALCSAMLASALWTVLVLHWSNPWRSSSSCAPICPSEKLLIRSVLQEAIKVFSTACHLSLSFTQVLSFLGCSLNRPLPVLYRVPALEKTGPSPFSWEVPRFPSALWGKCPPVAVMRRAGCCLTNHKMKKKTPHWFTTQSKLFFPCFSLIPGRVYIAAS